MRDSFKDSQSNISMEVLFYSILPVQRDGSRFPDGYRFGSGIYMDLYWGSFHGWEYLVRAFVE